MGPLNAFTAKFPAKVPPTSKLWWRQDFVCDQAISTASDYWTCLINEGFNISPVTVQQLASGMYLCPHALWIIAFSNLHLRTFLLRACFCKCKVCCLPRCIVQLHSLHCCSPCPWVHTYPWPLSFYVQARIQDRVLGQVLGQVLGPQIQIRIAIQPACNRRSSTSSPSLKARLAQATCRITSCWTDSRLLLIIHRQPLLRSAIRHILCKAPLPNLIAAPARWLT